MKVYDAVRFAREVTSRDVTCLRSAYLDRVDACRDSEEEARMLLPIRAALLSRNLAMSLVEVESVYRIVCQKLDRLVSVQSVSVAERWNGLCGYVDNSVDSPTVVYNKDLNFCWRRFTIVKELMHLWSGTADNLRRPDLGASLRSFK